MGGGYSEDYTCQVDLVLAQVTGIGVARAVLCKAECCLWYREEGVQQRFLGQPVMLGWSVGSRGVAGRGSAATGPEGGSGSWVSQLCWGGRWDPVGSLVVALLRLVPKGAPG